MTGCFPGISQSRISHWLLQHGSDLSEQKKRAFYRWYTLEKTTPGTPEPFSSSMAALLLPETVLRFILSGPRGLEIYRRLLLAVFPDG